MHRFHESPYCIRQKLWLDRRNSNLVRSSESKTMYVLIMPMCVYYLGLTGCTDLFLVDASITSRMLASLRANRLNMFLHLPLGLNRGGLVLPQLIGDVESSLYRSLGSFFSHPWHHHVLFSGVRDGCIRLHPETRLRHNQLIALVGLPVQLISRKIATSELIGYVISALPIN